jgi:Holliday junction resolvase
MSGRSSKAKGYGFEKELVDQANEKGILSKRAWGSNGKALGEAETVDLLIGSYRVQAKRRKSLPAYLKPPEGADAQIFRADREEALVVLPWKLFLDLVWNYRDRPDAS